MKIIYLITTLLFLPIAGLASMDSLLMKLPHATGEDRIQVLNDLSWQLKRSNPQLGEQYNKESLALCKENVAAAAKGRTLYIRGIYQHLRGVYDSSFISLNQSIDIYKQVNDYKGMVNNWVLAGINYMQQGKLKESLNYYQRAAEMSYLGGDSTRILTINLNIANIYFKQKNYSEALKIYHQNAAQHLILQDSVNYYINLLNIGKSYVFTNQYDQALAILFQVVDYYKVQNNQSILAEAYHEIGLAYMRLKMYEPALVYLLESSVIFEEFNFKRKIGLTQFNIGLCHVHLNKLLEAKEYYKTALAIYEEIGIEDIGLVLNNLGEIELKQKNYLDAQSLIMQSMEVNNQQENKWVLGLNYQNLGALAYASAQLDSAVIHYHKAYDLFAQLNSDKDLLSVAESLSIIYEELGKQQQQEKFAKIAQKQIDSLFDHGKLLATMQVIAKNHLRKRKTNKAAMVDTATNNNSLFVFSFLSLLLGLGGWYFFINKKPKGEAGFTVQSSQLIDKKNKELLFLTLDAAQKDDLIKKVKRYLVKNQRVPQKDIAAEQLLQQINSYEREDEYWQKFIQIFTEIEQEFINNITDLHPLLTSKELRLCLLIRLRVSVPEAAFIFGISTDSIHKSRYRVKRKMNLPKDISLDKYIENL